MTPCVFVSDIHGRIKRYEKLFDLILNERPACVFMGGDLLSGMAEHSLRNLGEHGNMVDAFLVPRFTEIRRVLGNGYPRVFLILGNDDSILLEPTLRAAEEMGLWQYMHNRVEDVGGYRVYGYACVPPTPFLNKDWERYDVSRYVDPGCVSPEEGRHAAPFRAEDIRYATIQADIAALTGGDDLGRAVMLFHTPPYNTHLDRAALDGQMIDHVPLDVHVGSIAVRRFIEKRQPLITLHGHIHESARLTGRWRDMLGSTQMFGAAHDGPELAVVRFHLEAPEKAERALL